MRGLGVPHRTGELEATGCVLSRRRVGPAAGPRGGVIADVPGGVAVRALALAVPPRKLGRCQWRVQGSTLWWTRQTEKRCLDG